MTLTAHQVAHLLTALTVMVLAAHAFGAAFAKLRQPAVIGEILAGLVLGPTLLGVVAAPFAAALFPSTGVTAAVLGALAELGLLLLMFVTGGEVKVLAAPRERRAVFAVATTGLVVPFAVGALVVQALDYGDFSGPNGSPVTFALVFSIAVAVTSIPVISRIMLDLGILDTSFARIVLSVAALEDVVLYVVLAVVLSIARAAGGEEYGLWALLGVESAAWSMVYHVLVTLGLFAAFLIWGGRVVRRLLYSRMNLVERRSPVAFRLALLLAAVLVCVVLGINPIFGALLAGMTVRRADLLAATDPAGGTGEPGTAAHPGAQHGAERAQRAWEAIYQFSLAFFIPVYFVTVGLKLDLVRNFDPVFFLWFLALGCGVKAASIWVGARLAAQPAGRAADLAVALNARGGPGIVLATVTLEAGVINESFFTSIVLLSMLTSQLAGFWLDRRLAAVTADRPRAQTGSQRAAPPPAEPADPTDQPSGTASSAEVAAEPPATERSPDRG